MRLDGDVVTEFSEKPEIQDHWINGRFFFFQRDFSLIFPWRKAALLEREPLVRLARDGKMCAYRPPRVLALHGYATRPGASNEVGGCRRDALARQGKTSIVKHRRDSAVSNEI